LSWHPYKGCHCTAWQRPMWTIMYRMHCALCAGRSWEHPSYIAHLSPCNFCVVVPLKEPLRGCSSVIHQLVHHLDACLNTHGYLFQQFPSLYPEQSPNGFHLNKSHINHFYVSSCLVLAILLYFICTV
jgi:hypothetical protein